MKVLELFAGYGSQHMALNRLGIDCECDISEIDKYVIATYNMIHGETKNYGDICKIDENSLPYYDLITYSFPCTDISVAGKIKGLTKGTGTRSSLLWECERIIAKVKPKYLLLENVKNLVGKKFKADFDEWLKLLSELGYNNYWQVLNSKDYDIPQNRERVFCVSIRKDVDLKGYKFPAKTPLLKRLKHVLETNVDEKYYLKEELVQKFKENFLKGYLNASKHPTSQAGKVHSEDGVFQTLTAGTHGYANGYAMIEEPIIAASRGRNPLNPSDRTAGIKTEQRLEINEAGISNTLTTVQKDNLVIEPVILDDTQGFEKEPRIYLNYSPNLRANRTGLKVIEPTINQLGLLDTKGNEQTRRAYGVDGISSCLNTMQGGNRQPKILDDYRIRKLTPRECWRLMGVDDSDFDKIKGISNTQLYKMAGNSIVVDVLEHIFERLLK